MFLCPKCSIPLQCRQCESDSRRSNNTRSMGRADQFSGGVIPYPHSPAPGLLSQGAPRDYANVNVNTAATMSSSVVLPPPVSAHHHPLPVSHHRRSPPTVVVDDRHHRVGGMMTGTTTVDLPSSSSPTPPPGSVDSMISLSLMKQKRQLVQQYEDEHRELDRQHSLLRSKLLEIYRQKVNELNPLLGPGQSATPMFPAAFPPPPATTVPCVPAHLSTAVDHRVPVFGSAVVPPFPELSSTTSAFFVTATSSPFDPAPTLEVSQPILLASPTTPAADPARDSRVLDVTRSQLEQCGWYHGALSWQESDALLARTAHGTFLLRDSQFRGCLYSLSINQAERGPTSIRINFAGGRFRLDSDAAVRAQMPAFSTVVELVEFYLNPHHAASASAISSPRNIAATADPNSAKNQVSLKYPLHKTPPTLAHTARLAINRSLAAAGSGDSSKRKNDVNKLELPKKMLQYLNSYRAVV